MDNLDVLRDVKKAVVAIGIAEKDTWKPLGFAGTGFLVSSDGYIITASHVIESCNEYVKTNNNLKTVIFTIQNPTNGFQILPVGSAKVSIPKVPDAYVGPGNLDISIGKVLGDDNSFSFLELRDDKPNLYDEIVTCGFPNPFDSLTIYEKTHEYAGIRHTPVTQFGHIAAFLPHDDYNKPYGIQTDIVGTGGSSGSPIISISDRKVIGIVQQVIPAQVNVNLDKVSAMAKIGLMFGLASGIIKQCFEAAKESREKGIPMHLFNLELPGMAFTEPKNTPPKKD